MTTMWEESFSDSFDCDSEIAFTLKQSMSGCVKPKFISSLGKNENHSFDLFPFLQQSKSCEVLKSAQTSSFQQRHSCKSDTLPQKTAGTSEKIKNCIEQIKKTTIYDDNPTNLCELFRKAQFLADLSHQNKRPVRFFLLEEKTHHNFMLIQKTTWSEFSLYDGKGILLLPDGRKIRAKWCRAQPVGPCEIIYPNKSMYCGQVNEQLQKHGHGYIYFSNGQKLESEFKQGKLDNEPIYYNKNRAIRRNHGFKDKHC